MFQKKLQPDRPAGSPGYPEMSSSSPPTPGEPAPAQMTPSSSSAPNTPGAATVLAEGARFVGKANVSGTIRVEGEAQGEIEAADAVIVGSTGNVQAQVQARRAVVNGRFQGKISAREGVEFQSGSHVDADIKAKNMVMEDGVRFRGNCEIGG
jgi:cytoskeletal protein CcmA (bactofilin family)